MKDKEELVVVREVGMFGNLGIEDPTATPVKSIDDIIEEAVKKNKENLCK